MAINLQKLKEHEIEAKKTISLLKLDDVQARVVQVWDLSGSIRPVFTSKTAHSAMLRLYAAMKQFDDNQELDSYIFSDQFARLPEVKMANFEDYVDREILYKFESTYSNYRQGTINNLTNQIERLKPKTTGGFLGFGKKTIASSPADTAKLNELQAQLRDIQGIKVNKSMEIFRGNNEVDVMNEIVRYYTQKNPSKLPTYVAFISDGGVSKNKEIEKIIRDSSNLPIFWQFIGLGKANYGALENFDNLTGRVVDNANFFPFDDINKVSDQELYKRLLGEFPQWIQAAKSKGIL